MKNKSVRRIATALAVSLGAFTFTACGGKVIDEIDETKTQLYISAYEAGYGTKWLEEFAAEFEELYKDESFEDGKIGVDVRLDWNQDNYSQLITKMPLSQNALYFNAVNYYELANSGYAMNFNDIVKTPLSEFGESDKTIEDKIPAAAKEFYKSYDGNYYAAPSYETYEGIQYDISLFEEKKLYFADTATRQWTSGLEGDLAKSAGPDNEKGTYDDGLPATYNEFFELCDQMVRKNVIPFVWGGTQVHYGDMLTQALWTKFEGYDQMNLNFTFNGTATDLINVSGGAVTPLGDVQINNANGYMLTKQEGIYRALEFMKKLSDNTKYYYGDSFSQNLDHIGAQERYLYSRFDEKSKPIAFLVEGTYWQEEASSLFESVNNRYGTNDEYTVENRRYGFMPLPHYNAAQAEKNHYKNTLTASSAICFGNNTVSDVQKTLAKKFVQFISTDKKVYDFYKMNHYARGLNVEFTPEQLDSLNYYAKSLYEAKKNSDIVYPFSANQFWLKYSASVFNFRRADVDGYVFNAGATLRSPVYNFNEDASLTAEKFFNEMYTNMQKKWADLKV